MSDRDRGRDRERDRDRDREGDRDRDRERDRDTGRERYYRDREIMRDRDLHRDRDYRSDRYREKHRDPDRDRDRGRSYRSDRRSRSPRGDRGDRERVKDSVRYREKEDSHRRMVRYDDIDDGYTRDSRLGQDRSRSPDSRKRGGTQSRTPSRERDYGRDDVDRRPRRRDSASEDRRQSTENRGRRRTRTPSASPVRRLRSPDAMDTANDSEEDETVRMAKLMGFAGFGTTKQKRVVGNNVGSVAKEKVPKYRQYMYVFLCYTFITSVLDTNYDMTGIVRAALTVRYPQSRESATSKNRRRLDCISWVTSEDSDDDPTMRREKVLTPVYIIDLIKYFHETDSSY
ncbi:hypothetical protein V1527DRAFT_467107 [Lipomyces starkeyi]